LHKVKTISFNVTNNNRNSKIDRMLCDLPPQLVYLFHLFTH